MRRILSFKIKCLLIALAWQCSIASAQTNLLLNGGFEEVNTCTEYNAECGVEGWFYLKDVKAQMLSNETNFAQLGTNSFGIFYNWLGYDGFTPIIGAVLPCGLQKNNRYTFKGIISARLNPKLTIKPGICVGEKFYVPRRAFSKDMHPDSIPSMVQVPNTNFYQFEYSFVADGKEKYLTFGTYISQDTLGGKKALIGIQTVSLVLDNFQLIPSDPKETVCPAFASMKKNIYNYNFRHKEMDYSLYGRGEIAISFPEDDNDYITQRKEPPPLVEKPDTLKLGDVFFDFNKATLKPSALRVLEKYFLITTYSISFDSIYIEGHTDSIGSDARNLQLSLERCASVKQWLKQYQLLPDEKIQVHPFGRSRPIATNKTATGRALNRRVEIIIFRKVKQ